VLTPEPRVGTREDQVDGRVQVLGDGPPGGGATGLLLRSPSLGNRAHPEFYRSPSKGRGGHEAAGAGAGAGGRLKAGSVSSGGGQVHSSPVITSPTIPRLGDPLRSTGIPHRARSPPGARGLLVPIRAVPVQTSLGVGRVTPSHSYPPGPKGSIVSGALQDSEQFRVGEPVH
jgi:hypothetical protein